PSELLVAPCVGASFDALMLEANRENALWALQVARQAVLDRHARHQEYLARQMEEAECLKATMESERVKMEEREQGQEEEQQSGGGDKATIVLSDFLFHLVVECSTRFYEEAMRSCELSNFAHKEAVMSDMRSRFAHNRWLKRLLGRPLTAFDGKFAALPSTH
ncbi:hypothetical protein BGX33_007640, partial [Mortierella sp. NVP41]